MRSLLPPRAPCLQGLRGQVLYTLKPVVPHGNTSSWADGKQLAAYKSGLGRDWRSRVGSVVAWTPLTY